VILLMCYKEKKYDQIKLTQVGYRAFPNNFPELSVHIYHLHKNLNIQHARNVLSISHFYVLPSYTHVTRHGKNQFLLQKALTRTAQKPTKLLQKKKLKTILI
jgi:hypothetical protein